VLRSGNKKAAAFTFLGDCLKGWVVVGSVVYWGEQWGILDNGVAYVAMAVFFGHLWPIFFNFKGGKGVATALGILFGMNIWLGVAALVSWLVVFYAFRYSSLAALITAVFAPFYYGLLFGPDIQLSAVTVISMLLVYRHRRNIADLLKGKEKRMRQEKR
jgi:glycerol-3-phosphate acyltransferase PlsY